MKAATQTADLVARDEELERALHSLRFSGGVLITGQAGVGKTALAAAVADRLSHAAGRLGGGHRGQPDHPAGRAGQPAAGRSGHHPSGPDRPARRHPAAGAESRPSRPHRRRAPPVLVLDDAQLLDAQSAAVLLSLVAAKSLRLLVTMRSGSTPSDAVTALWKEQLVDRLDLSPLDPHGDSRSCSRPCSADRSRRAPWRCSGPAAAATRST